MKIVNNILIAFILNIILVVILISGGIVTNSIAIFSATIHDITNTISIGIAYYLEKKSKHRPNYKYTYGYTRYSVLSAFITTIILIVSSMYVIYEGISRIIDPTSVNYDGIILLSILGILFNTIAVYKTRKGKSLNQETVNLHSLNGILSWTIILFGAIIMDITKINNIDAIISVLVALCIFAQAMKHLKMVLDLFLEKTPNNINIRKLKKEILKNECIVAIDHIHIWSMDGYNNYATLHVKINNDEIEKTENYIKNILKEKGIEHTTIEIERKKYGKSLFYKRNK